MASEIGRRGFIGAALSALSWLGIAGHKAKATAPILFNAVVIKSIDDNRNCECLMDSGETVIAEDFCGKRIPGQPIFVADKKPCTCCPASSFKPGKYVKAWAVVPWGKPIPKKHWSEIESVVVGPLIRNVKPFTIATHDMDFS